MRLTKRTVEATRADSGRDVVSWDDALPGFGVRIKPSGVKSFIVQYRSGGRSRRLTLGRYGPLTVQQARKNARAFLGRVAQGEDPAAERQAERRNAVTVADLADRFLEHHARPKKKPSSVRMDILNLRNHVVPALGRLRVDQVTRADVARLHHAMRRTPGAANRVLALLSKLFSIAEAWGLRRDGSNPCRHVERFRERARERFLSPEELGRLGEALELAESNGSVGPEAIAAIRLLLLTGCRAGEILSLRWDYVDLPGRLLRLPDSKTGAKVVPLNTAACQVIETLPRTSNWVLPGRRVGNHVVNVRKPWQRICSAARLEDVRLHDLRHTHASTGAASGISLTLLGKILGHRVVGTTFRYVNLAGSDDPVREASERIGQSLAAAMDGRASAPIVQLRRG